MLLAIETTALACSVALINDRQIVASLNEDVGRGHAERLIPMIANLPGGGQADEIIVSCGPGSFTGVRVGIAAAKGLALAWGVPLHGYTALASMAARQFAIDPSLSELLVAIEGGHGQIFVQPFANNGKYGDLRSITVEEAAQSCRSKTIVGNAAVRLALLLDDCTAIPAVPDANDAAYLSQQLRSMPAKPIYGRAPDAKPPA
jgi:tRNA threonylcarbamoyladenosine biosynthesis protein TsaB